MRPKTIAQEGGIALIDFVEASDRASAGFLYAEATRPRRIRSRIYMRGDALLGLVDPRALGPVRFLLSCK
jgi:hypothetical protein